MSRSKYHTQKYSSSKEGYKVCHKCLNELPATSEYFTKYSHTPDGLMRYCKKCWKTIRSDTKNNREKANEYARNYHAKHREEERHWHKTYRLTPKGKINEVKCHTKRRIKIGSLPIFFTSEQWTSCKRYFNNKCAYCGEEKPLTVEHFIPLSKGGELTINNIIPACKSCNSSKHDTDFIIWYKRQGFYSKEREKQVLKYLGYIRTKSHKIQQLQIGV